MNKNSESKIWKPSGKMKKLKLPNNFDEDTILSGWIPVSISNNWLTTKIPKLIKVPLADISEVQSFKTSKRLEEYLSGRFLLGELVKLWKPQIDLSRIEVRRNKITRAPYLVWIKDRISNFNLPNFSISHAGGIAVCILTEHHVSIGIDLEPLDEKRTMNMLSIIAKGDEKEQLIVDWKRNPIVGKRNSLCVWTAKESIQKALNQGMNLNPMSFIIPRGNLDHKPIENSTFQLKINDKTLNVFITELQFKNQSSMNNYICSITKTELVGDEPVKYKSSIHNKLMNYQSRIGCNIG